MSVIKERLVAACLLAGQVSSLFAQQPPAQPLNWSAGDSAHIAWLEKHGRRLEGKQVVIWAPPDDMSAGWQAALIDSLDRGVIELRRMIGAPLPWQRIGNRPVQYYLVSERMISHASGRDVVFISMFHVRKAQAPYFHEAVHELLAPPPPFFYAEYPDTVQAEAMYQATPLWLAEGLADVLAERAATATGMVEGDVFTIGGLEKADSTCASRLAENPYRTDILRAIGGQGGVDALYTEDRSKVAPVFYACAQSMSKYLVEIIGLEQTVELFPAIKRGDWVVVLERAAGMPLATVRSRWQARLGLDSPP